jgi:glucose/arabinose dehydrogenase
VSQAFPVTRITLLVCALAFLSVPTAPALLAQTIRTEVASVRLNVLTEGLEHPWSIAFLPDGRMLVTERPGRLRIIAKDGTLQPQPVAGLPTTIEERGQGGLLDVQLHPRFAENELVYLAYAERGEGGSSTAVARGKLNGARLDNVEVIFRQLPKSRGGRHFGCRLVFDRSGLLYITLGERGEQERAQNLDDLGGKVVRVHDDGRVPKDNPFVGKPGARPEIFTFGNRNVQGAALHPTTGELWALEHGPQGGDEVNILRAGVNYGWPVITYGVNYGTGTKIGEGTAKPGMAQPLHYWVPSISPSGMAFYTGDKFPQWRGDLFVGALTDRSLVRLRLNGEKVVQEERMLQGALGRIRDVRQGPDGYLYLLVDAGNGKLVRLEP